MPCSILVVEDDSMSRIALVAILMRLGHQVASAETVAEAQAVLDGQDCVILDLNLPDGMGTAILQRIREESRSMRVAVATATTDDALLSEARKLRPDLLLHKPFDLKVLLAWLDDAGPTACPSLK